MVGVGWGVLLCDVARAATVVAGGSVTSDLVWTKAGSPYVLQADLSVKGGATLTIEAGTEVRVASADALGAGNDAQRVELVIEGALRAQGTPAAPITLHADAGPGVNSWYGVMIPPTATEATLAYVDIEDANSGLTSAAPGKVLALTHATSSHNVAGLSLSAGEPLLDDLQLSDNSAYGLFVLANEASVSLSLTSSVALSNGSYGIYLLSAQGHGVTAHLDKLTVYGNISAGVTTKASGAGSFANVTLTTSIVSSNGIIGIDASASDDALLTFDTTYSDVWSNGLDFSGAEPGVGCIDVDPLFVAPPSDLSLQPSSPCIDAGDPSGEDLGAPFDSSAAGAMSLAGASGAPKGDPSSSGSGGDLAASAGTTSDLAGNAATVPSPPAAAADDDCACHLGHAPTTSAFPWLTLAALLLLGTRRRARDP